jgi:6-phosphogluconolactonase
MRKEKDFIDSSKSKVLVVSDVEELSRTAANILVHKITEVLQNKEIFTLALSGGSTPKSLFALLAKKDDSYYSQIPWNKVHFFWGDERHVPPDHIDSNYRMTNETMLSVVSTPAENVHRVRGENPDSSAAALEYEQVLRSFFQLGAGQVPRFDCVLLGMGGDGHTASLFPHSSALHERDRLVVANWIEKFQSYRITMTVPVLNNADNIIFLVSGAEKADALKAVLEGDEVPDQLPSQLIRPAHGHLLWLVDEAGASKLTFGGKR